MLNLSKIEEGNVPVHYVQEDVIPFVRLVVCNFQGFADFRKIRLLFEPKSPQLMMDIDAVKLEESLSNLISNAIKYTPEGGEVHVTVRELKPSKTDSHSVEIIVCDTGIGISESQLDKIFLRFYRVEDKNFPYQEGTGIGLTLVNEYMKLMNGSVRVSSTLGKGSEFILRLPIKNNVESGEIMPAKNQVANKAPVFEPLDEKIEINGTRPLLLIIEDNPELIAHLVRLLKEEYRVLTAHNGIEGVELAREHIPDLILSDVMMPGKDGCQVCKELKNDFRTNHIPVVLLTARADTDSRIRGLENGADVYLTKPFNKKELMICLNNLFVQRETLRLKFSAQILEKSTIENEMGLNEKFLTRVITNLEKNYHNDRYGIYNLYSDMNISRVQLHRKLTALTGLAASGFIRSFRLQKARNLLLQTQNTVTDIAYEVGFSDANYFSKAFLSEYGLTASEYRKSFG
jgi:CheY-like chemotaxis protein